MSIATIVTRGYGSFGSIAEIVTRGYGIGEAPIDVPTPSSVFVGAGGGFGGPSLAEVLAFFERRKKKKPPRKPRTIVIKVGHWPDAPAKSPNSPILEAEELRHLQLLANAKVEAPTEDEEDLLAELLVTHLD